MYKENNQNWKFFIKSGFKESQLFEHVFSKKKSIKFQRDYKFPDTLLLLHKQQKRKFYESQNYNSEEGIEYLLNKILQIENLSLNFGLKKSITLIQAKLYKKIWPILTNAFANMKIFKSTYFQKLKNSNNLSEQDQKQINLDLDRTTFNNSDLQYKEQLQNIFKCFCIRNPKKGYIQGMNELGLFLLGTDFGEEITFWILNYIFEHIYPLDYFENVNNAKEIDFFIIKKLMKIFLKDQKEIYDLFIQNITQFSQIFIKLFMTIFTHRISSNRLLLMHIYHNIFLEGFFSIYKTILSLFRCFIDNLNKNKVMNNKEQNLVDQFFVYVNSTSVKKSYKKYYKELYLNYDLLWQIRKNQLSKIQNNQNNNSLSFINISQNNSINSQTFEKFTKQKTIQEKLRDYGVQIYQTDTQMKNIQVDYHLEKTQEDNLSINNQVSQKNFLLQENNYDTEIKNSIKDQTYNNGLNEFTMNDSLSIIQNIEDKSQFFNNVEFIQKMQNRKQMKRHKCFNKDINKDIIAQQQEHQCKDDNDFQNQILLYKQDLFTLSKKLRKKFNQKLQEPNKFVMLNNSYYEENLNLSELNELELKNQLQNCQSFISDKTLKNEIQRKGSYNVQHSDSFDCDMSQQKNSNFSLLSIQYVKEQIN